MLDHGAYNGLIISCVRVYEKESCTAGAPHRMKPRLPEEVVDNQPTVWPSPPRGRDKSGPYTPCVCISRQCLLNALQWADRRPAEGKPREGKQSGG